MRAAVKGSSADVWRAQVLCFQAVYLEQGKGKGGGEGTRKGEGRTLRGKRKGAEESRESGQSSAGWQCSRFSPPSHPPEKPRSCMLITCTAF